MSPLYIRKTTIISETETETDTDTAIGRKDRDRDRPRDRDRDLSFWKDDDEDQYSHRSYPPVQQERPLNKKLNNTEHQINRISNALNSTEEPDGKKVRDEKEKGERGKKEGKVKKKRVNGREE